jgi:hypothetical protein
VHAAVAANGGIWVGGAGSLVHMLEDDSQQRFLIPEMHRQDNWIFKIMVVLISCRRELI